MSGTKQHDIVKYLSANKNLKNKYKKTKSKFSG